MKNKKKLKKNTKRKIIILIVLLLLIAIAGGVYYASKNNWFLEIETKIKKEKKEEPKLQILNLESNQRPYAVMIDNVADARPQYNIQKAYMLYEIIVEGGLTRMMAVFKDVDVEQIGPVRSARHYFIDYAMENDAIYVHFGWSPQAQNDLSKYDWPFLNGLYNPSNMFWRDSNLHKAPHNAYTSTDNIATATSNKGFRSTSDDYLVLNYDVYAIDLAKKYDPKPKTSTNESTGEKETDYGQRISVDANNITINYSDNVYSAYTYDTNSQTYFKYANKKEHLDASTNEQLKVKNVIVLTGISNHTIDTEKGRQDIGNVGEGEGYYFTNGKAIKITWKKTSRDSKTEYFDPNGDKLKVNDGNTFVHLQPKGESLNIN